MSKIKTDPLVNEIHIDLTREFDALCISGKSIIGVIIQEESPGYQIPQIITSSRFSHVKIAVQDEQEHLCWYEFTKGGAKKSPLYKSLVSDEGLALVRPTVVFSELDIKIMRSTAWKLIGLKYDTPGLLGKLLHIIFGRKKWKRNPLSNSGYFCSAGVEFIYRAGGFRLTEYDDVRLNEPKDIYLNEQMERIV